MTVVLPWLAGCFWIPGSEHAALVERLEESGCQATDVFRDVDGDGFGNPQDSQTVCDVPDGYSLTASDCDDTNAMFYPGQGESCDGFDEDCDGEVDELPVDGTVYYEDTDGDGVGIEGVAQSFCAEPESGWTVVSGACDDADAARAPGHEEVCNEIDDDCDEAIDQDAVDSTTWFFDGDADGYGDVAITVQACDLPDGYSANSTDCDDSANGTFPGADEYCAGGDENCDGATNEDTAVDALPWYLDDDEDGYGAGTATVSCVAPADHVASDTDCADDDGAVSPAATEVCDDTVDDDCDGRLDNDCGPVGGLTSADADAWAIGEAAGDFLGGSVAVSGDITGDGVADILATANDHGIYVLQGSNSGAYAMTSIPSISATDRYMVTAGGDYDGDGSCDALSIGYAGANKLYYGPVDSPAGGAGSANLSASIQNAGLADLDADGVAEIIIVDGSQLSLDVGPSVGIDGSWTATSTIGSVFGGGADLSGDGIDDFAAGDGSTTLTILDGAEMSAGSAYADVATATLVDTTGSDFGSDVALLPDADGDGYGDVLVGARYADITYTNGGIAWLIAGPPSAMTAIAGASFVGTASSAYAGTTVGTADIDGDGRSDVLIGGATSPNQAWLQYAPFSPATYDLDLAEANFTGFGSSSPLVLTGADLEGTGVDTLAIGHYSDVSGGVAAGAVWLFSGGGR